MCTLTYIPKKDGGFYITHNRDEAVYRNAESIPSKFLINNIAVVSPIDPESKGTWIAMGSNGTIACLLNGGFKKHQRDLPYRHSRGIIIFDFFNYHSMHDFMTNYDLTEIEPFTLIVIHNHQLWEVVWDGSQKHLKKLDRTKPHFYSSSTLYTDAMKSERKTWFSDWLEEKETPSLKEILDFHHHAGAPNKKYGLIMQRGEILRTVGITSIERSSKALNLIYENLVDQKISTHKLNIKKAAQLV